MFTTSDTQTHIKKLFLIESLDKKIFQTFRRKHFNPAGFHKTNQKPHPVCFFHLLPIFILAFRLHPGGWRFGSSVCSGTIYRPPSLSPSLPSSPGIAETLKGEKLDPPGVLCLHLTPPSSGSHRECSALARASQAHSYSSERHHNLEIKIE